jgi:hypothetical protein
MKHCLWSFDLIEICGFFNSKNNVTVTKDEVKQLYKGEYLYTYTFEYKNPTVSYQ